ncbi:MAG: hypothetical protein AB7V46_19575 [Thermomicrobiales bacterium]
MTWLTQWPVQWLALQALASVGMRRIASKRTLAQLALELRKEHALISEQLPLGFQLVNLDAQFLTLQLDNL